MIDFHGDEEKMKQIYSEKTNQNGRLKKPVFFKVDNSQKNSMINQFKVWKSAFFSLNVKGVRLTKIMNNLVKDLKILSFKIIFECLKLVESFQKKL